MSQLQERSRRKSSPDAVDTHRSVLDGVDSLPFQASVTTGTVVGFTRRGEPLVLFEGSPVRSSVVAQSCVYLERRDVGRTALLHLQDRDPCRPLIIGMIIPSPLRAAPGCLPKLPGQHQEHAELVGERVVLRAGRELVMECGEASVTLASNGCVSIRGSQVVSRASGVNAIRGGSVEIN